VAHERRERFTAREPNHVTLRMVEGLGSLRKGRFLRVVKRAISAGGRRQTFRVCHFNLLSNHLHLLVEADGNLALARGMQGLAVRLASGLNRVLKRKGKLFAERFHTRALRSPREVRNALRYVLLNARHHAAEARLRLSRDWVDPYSSAPWFAGWRRPIPADEPWIKDLLAETCPTAPAMTWLLSEGWRRWGPLAMDEVPGRVASRG
jgi:REP element-mobilizing transposase RayT